MVANAQEEGHLVIYGGLPEAQLQTMAEGFEEAYGISVDVQRIVGPELATRFASEADADAVTADVLLVSSSPQRTAADWFEQSWLRSIEDAGVPTVVNGEFPEDFSDGRTAVMTFQLWSIGYNTDLVDEAEIPTSFADLADPSWEGRLVGADPAASDAYLTIFTALHEEYGEEWFSAIVDNGIEWQANGSAAVQSLGAGEYAVFPVTGPSLITDMREDGAPVEIVVPDFTTLIESHLFLVAGELAPHPNAASLFAEWVLSPEGQSIATDYPGALSAYSDSLPPDYVRVDESALLTQDELAELFGR